MSRNLERLGLGKKPDNIDAPQAGGGLEFVTPTEFVDLPSKGLFYPEEHPLHNVDTIEIRQMTAKEEDILTNKSFIKKGIVFDRLMNSIIVDRRIKSDDLLVGDRNAIILATRVSGYGEEYRTKTICPLCMSQSDKIYDLQEIESNLWQQQLEDLDVTLDEDGLFTVVLPASNFAVLCRPINGHDEKALGELKDSDSVTGQLKQFVVKINDETDKRVVHKAIDGMPARDAKYLRNTYKKVTPNLDFIRDFVCGSCGHEAELEVRLGPDFFWFE
jgi:hypothetical protein